MVFRATNSPTGLAGEALETDADDAAAWILGEERNHRHEVAVMAPYGAHKDAVCCTARGAHGIVADALLQRAAKPASVAEALRSIV